MDILTWVINLIFFLPAILISSTIHEYAHAFVATKLGDYTAKSEGRLSLNPLIHIDPIGAFVMLISGFRFGWSKPVPINENNFNKPVFGTALVAFAGPLSNILLAIITGIILKLFYPFISDENILQLIILSSLTIFLYVNIGFAVFNLFPIPPLDGHRIVRALIPDKFRYYWEKIEMYSPIILIIFFLPFSPLNTILRAYLEVSFNFFLRIVSFGVY